MCAGSWLILQTDKASKPSMCFMLLTYCISHQNIAYVDMCVCWYIHISTFYFVINLLMPMYYNHIPICACRVNIQISEKFASSNFRKMLLIINLFYLKNKYQMLYLTSFLTQYTILPYYFFPVKQASDFPAFMTCSGMN